MANVRKINSIPTSIPMYAPNKTEISYEIWINNYLASDDPYDSFELAYKDIVNIANANMDLEENTPYQVQIVEVKTSIYTFEITQSTHIIHKDV